MTMRDEGATGVGTTGAVGTSGAEGMAVGASDVSVDAAQTEQALRRGDATGATTTPDVPLGGGEQSVVLTRSEEELQVTKVRRPYEAVRVTTRIVTEQRTITVPIRREEVTIERVPVDQATARATFGGPGGQHPPEGYTIVVSEEQVVDVQKRIVPIERVRLTVEQVTDQRQVTDALRKERIDVERGTVTAPVDAPAIPPS